MKKKLYILLIAAGMATAVPAQVYNQMNEDGTYKKDAAGKNIPYSYSIDYTIAQNQTKKNTLPLVLQRKKTKPKQKNKLLVYCPLFLKWPNRY